MVRLSTYRKWQGRYLFKPEETEYIFHGKKRLYLSVQDTSVGSAIPAVESQLLCLGFTIVDYKRGIAARQGRTFKIGKILNKAKAFGLKKLFDHDPARRSSNKGGLVAVICRHPYDIAGLGSGRGWKSCFELEGGSYKHKLEAEVANSNLVAYLVDENDRNIQKPIARYRIVRYTKDGENVWLRAPIAYGETTADFTETIDNWLYTLNSRASGLFQLSSNIHKDGVPHSVLRATELEHLTMIEDCTDVVIQNKELAEIAVLNERPSVIQAALECGLLDLEEVRDALLSITSYPQLEMFAASQYSDKLETELTLKLCCFPQYADRFEYFLEKNK